MATLLSIFLGGDDFALSETLMQDGLPCGDFIIGAGLEK